MFRQIQYIIRKTLDNICGVFDKRVLGRFAWYKSNDETIVPGRIVQVHSRRFVLEGVLYTVLTRDGKIDYIEDHEVVHISKKTNTELDEYNDYVDVLVRTLWDKNKEIDELTKQN